MLRNAEQSLALAENVLVVCQAVDACFTARVSLFIVYLSVQFGALMLTT